jgi:hypothetical protein
MAFDGFYQINGANVLFICRNESYTAGKIQHLPYCPDYWSGIILRRNFKLLKQ